MCFEMYAGGKVSPFQFYSWQTPHVEKESSTHTNRQQPHAASATRKADDAFCASLVAAARAGGAAAKTASRAVA